MQTIFPLVLKRTNPNSLLKFSFELLNEEGELLIKFISGEKKITLVEFSNPNFRMIETLRSEQNGSNFSKQIQEIVDDLRKDLARLQIEPSKKNKNNKQLN